MRWAVLLVLPALAGCTAAATTYQPSERPTQYGSVAMQKDNPAKGTKTCTVSQFESRHVEQLTGQILAGSILVVNVNRDGTIGLAVSEDTYPGTKSYFMVDGNRYSGDGDHYVAVPAKPLIADGVVQYTYTDWPYRGDHSGEDVMEGFKAAYDQCLAFLK